MTENSKFPAFWPSRVGNYGIYAKLNSLEYQKNAKFILITVFYSRWPTKSRHSLDYDLYRIKFALEVTNYAIKIHLNYVKWINWSIIGGRSVTECLLSVIISKISTFGRNYRGCKSWGTNFVWGNTTAIKKMRSLLSHTFRPNKMISK